MSSNSDRRLTLGLRVLYSFCFFAVLLRSLGSIMKISTIADGGSILRSLWLIMFVVEECLSALYKVFVLRKLWITSPVISPASFADYFLLLSAVDVPMFNSMASLTFHDFLKDKNTLFATCFINCVNSLALPPAHAIFAWMLSSLPFM